MIQHAPLDPGSRIVAFALTERDIRTNYLRRLLAQDIEWEAVQCVWRQNRPYEVSLANIDCAAWYKAHTTKLWSRKEPWFDVPAAAAEIWEDTFNQHTAASEDLEKEIRIAAYQRKDGNAIIAQAERVLARAEISMPRDFLVAICRNVAATTVRTGHSPRVQR